MVDNQKKISARGKAAQRGNEQKRRFEKEKAKVFELEKENYSQIIIFASTGGWWKMGGHSALYYTYYLAKQLNREARLLPDGDYYSKFWTGIVSIRDIESLEKSFDEILKIKINSKMSELRNQLGLGANSEFKFSRTNKRNIIKVLNMVKMYDFCIYVACHQKNNKLATIGGRNIYDNILLKLVNEIDAGELNMEIDGKVGKTHRRQVKTFIRKNSLTVKIKHFRFIDSKSSNLIQLADLVAGSIGRSYTMKPDVNIYKDLISGHIVKIIEV